MIIKLSDKYDFCGLKDIFINGIKEGSVLRYRDGSFEIRVQKVIKVPNRSSYSISTRISTTNEGSIITLISNFFNDHHRNML